MMSETRLDAYPEEDIMGKTPSGLSDLDSAGMRRISRELAASQASYVARTLPICAPLFGLPEQSLHLEQTVGIRICIRKPAEQRWQNPRRWLGITFLPFYLGERGSEVSC